MDEQDPESLSAVDAVASNVAELSDSYDRRLVGRVAEGDRDAFAELYRRHSRVLLAQISLLVGDRALSEEILQDTMVAVWRGASTFRGDARPRSWMIAIARRQTRDRTRRRRLTNADPGLLSEWPDASPGPELQVLDRVEMTAVAAILPSLRPAHREVLGLVFGAGLTLQEAGDVLKVPVGTVKSRLSAARAALAEQLLEKGYDR